MNLCPNCSSDNTQPYFKVHNSPKLQNVLYRSLNEALDVKVLSCNFWLCNDCVCLWNTEFEKQIYDEVYENDQSYSNVYQKHLNQIVSILTSVTKPADHIIEIGCGTGDILHRLVKDNGYKNVIGYDPSHSKNYKFIRKIFWENQFSDTSGRADLVIVRHVIEGHPNPNQFLTDIFVALKDSGKLYLEMMSLSHIFATAETHNLYHEYQQYFSESSITILLAKCGYKVECFHKLWDGEQFGVIASKQSIKQLTSLNRCIFDQFEKICIWGISGRTIHFLTHNKIGTDQIQFAVDIDPKKQGKYVPVTGQRIFSPLQCRGKNPNCVIVLNPLYLDEVREQFNYPITILAKEDIYQ